MAKKTGVSVGDVNAAYDGAIGRIWEMLMGDFIHVGGQDESRVLAEKAGIKKGQYVLDICSALGGPARFLAKTYGCRVAGLDATLTMHLESKKRTAAAGLSDLVSFHLGNALDIPFHDATFDVVWGEDAWCYITDKDRLIGEVARVLKPGGTLAFTDWLQSPKAPAEVIQRINTFMIFPDVQTLDGYAALCKKHGLKVSVKEDLFAHFAKLCQGYIEQAGGPLKKGIVDLVGPEMFQGMAGEMVFMGEAAKRGEFGRGRIVAKK
jgi:ubiquinone/menaquinone biosynthesis C-methylase UbiE